MRKWQKSLLYIPLVLFAFVFIFPMIWVIMSSFKTEQQIFAHLMPFSLKSISPFEINFKAYYKIFFLRKFGIALFNSFFVTISALLGGLIFNSMCAFGFAAFHFRGREILFVLVLVTFMIPFGSIALPLYQVVRSLNWIDTYWALIVPAVANGLCIFLFRQFFLEIPRDYIDACRIDGAGWWTIYARIYMSLSIPVIISAGLIIFLFQWEAFLWPLIAARSANLKVIQVAIADFNEENQVLWSEIFAACTISVLIPVAIVLPLQRFYIRGITGTGLKG
ncbi:MAG: carbohydrate ABC transporter permease [Spirochaetales bacterium]|nr:carbohydrate ABC transporter permease [Spirochaetales bacterium]